MSGFLAYIIPVSEGVPTHPIAPGGPPPGIWGGGNVPMPNPPIHLPPGSPGAPTHPIYYPPHIWGPTDPRPGYGLPGQPPHIWGGGNVPMPTPPIELPGGGVPPTGGPPQQLIEWRVAWTPETGWVVVGIPQVPVPTPSKK